MSGPLSVGDSPNGNTVAYVLAVTVGFLGGHHFYLRRWGWGILYLFSCGLGGVGVVVDLIRMPWLVRDVNEARKEEPGLADAYTLWFSPLGLLGAHRYYLGHFWWGVIYTLTGGLLMLGWLFDAFMLPQLVENERRSREKKLVRGDRPENVHHSNWFLVAEASFKCFTTLITECSICVMLVCAALMVGAVAAWLGGALTVDQSAADSPGQVLAINNVAVKQFFASSELIFRDRGGACSDPFSTLLLIFAGEGGRNMITVESVKEMARVEAAIEGDSVIAAPLKTPVGNTYDRLCQLTYADNVAQGCKRPLSFVNDLVFEGRRPTAADLQSLSPQRVEKAVRDALYPENSTHALIYQFFDKAFLDAYAELGVAMPLHSTHVRSQVFFGAPFDGGKPLKSRDVPYRNFWDRTDEQQQRFGQEWGDKFVDWFEATDTDVKGIGVFYLDNVITGVEVARLVRGDFMLVAAAGVAVAVVMAVQLQSIFLTLAGMFHVIMSYPIAVCIYHEVLQIRINPQFNLLALFLIMGIGADDIFVFTDCWKQSEHELGVSLPRHGRGALAERVFWVWRKASGAMAVTSCTTFAAFLCTAISPIPTISTFGIMAALITLFNYLLVISWFPACVVFYHKYVRNEVGPCRAVCCRCLYKRSLLSHLDDEEASAQGGAPSEQRNWTGGLEALHDATEASEKSEVPKALRRRSSVARRSAEVDVSKYRFIERFFYKALAPLIHKTRFLLLAGGLVLLVTMSIGAATLQPPSKEPVGLPKASQLYKALEIMNNKFPPSESFGFEVTAIWGVDGADAITRGSVDRNNQKRFGRVNMDSAFKLNAATFRSIHDACVTMQEATRDGKAMVAPNGVKCVLKDFKDYLYGPSGPLSGQTYPAGLFDDDLVMGQHMVDFLRTTDQFGQTWATTYENYVGGIRNRATARPTYIMVPMSSTIPQQHTTDDADDWMRRWKSVEDQIRAGAPASAGKPFITSMMFALRETQKIIVRETYMSILISFAVAIVFLLLATRNWKITALASLTIACIVVCILGIIQYSGDGLGFVQSICATVLVGLSVDYVVHYGVAYHEASMSDRFLRARAAMLELGVSIVGGSVTSLISNFFLLATQLVFFQVFGKFIVFTISLAFLWATFFFMPALMVLGPKEHGDGDIAFRRLSAEPEPRPDPRSKEVA